MRTIRKRVVAVLVVVFCFAASPVFSETMEGKMTAMLAGAGSHQAAGTLAITKDRNGRSILTMIDITVDRVPDGRVYLAKDGDYAQGVELGRLTQFSGTVEYSIPAGIDAQHYNSVVIWCKRFSVEIGRGTFVDAIHTGM